MYISTFEEARVLDAVGQMCVNKSQQWSYVVWDIASGLYGTDTSYVKEPQGLDQIGVLEWFYNQKIEKDKYLILVLLDFYKFLAPDGHAGQLEITTIRQLKNLVDFCTFDRKAVVIIGAKYFLPIELEKYCALIDWPLPEKEHIHAKIDSILKHADKRTDIKQRFETQYEESDMDAIVRSFQGLTIKEIELITAYFILTKSKLFPGSIAAKKRDIIRKSGLVEWIDLDKDFSGIGGLNELKLWLKKREFAFSDEAIEYGLPQNPKGLLLVGFQGSGKSLASRAIAYFWKLPLIRLDIGKIFSSLVGSSEENLRNIIKLAESVSPVILWIDELDKGLGGVGGVSDGGTSARVFASLLTWMQEKTKPVFIVATANDVSFLPPELLRKGRFDEIFFVDLPNDFERQEIFNIHLIQRQRDPLHFDMTQLIEHSHGYTGAEIEASIISALYEAYSDNKRALQTNDIVVALEETVPLSIVMKEKMEFLQKWAEGRARHASKKTVMGKLQITPPIHDNAVSYINENEEL